MKCVVIKDFIDLVDEKHHYVKGDKYPRKGKSAQERIDCLLSSSNKAGEPVIIEVKEG